MGILVVGSVALDSVKTPSGTRADVLGGSAMYFSVAASYFSDVSMVAVVGRGFSGRAYSLFAEEGNRHFRARAPEGQYLQVERGIWLRPEYMHDAGHAAQCLGRFFAETAPSPSRAGIPFPGQYRSGIAALCSGAGESAQARRLRYHELLDQQFQRISIKDAVRK